MNIPIYTGDFQEWQSFFDLFNSAVHGNLSLTASQKLQYLKGLLRGEPLGLIKHLGVTDANYIEAYQILVKRYDKKKLIINRYIETFFKQPSVTRATASNIRKLADTAEEITRGLKAMGSQGESRDPWLVYIIVNKLDDDSRQFWQHESSKIECPTIQNLIECLQTRADTLEGIRETTSKPIVRTPILRGSHTTITTNLICPLCNVEHLLYQCSKFKEMNVMERRSFITEKSRYYNCLSESHTVRTCKAKRSCQICRKRHNSLLHVSDQSIPRAISQPSTAPVVNTVHTSPNMSTSEPSSTYASINIPANTQLNSVIPSSPPINMLLTSRIGSTTTSAPSINIHHSGDKLNQTVIGSEATTPATQITQPNLPTFQSLLPTAMVNVTDACGSMQPCRVLLDSGSQASFVTEDCINRLAFPQYKTHIAVKGVGSSTAGTSRRATELEISSRFAIGPKLKIDALILPSITYPIPSTKVNPKLWDHFKDLPLADPTFHQTGTIDILIGAECFFEILTEGKISGNHGEPVAQNTIFGWIFAGGSNANTSSCVAQLTSCTNPDIDHLIQKFWETEEVPITKHFTIEEILCETHFAETHQRTNEGRFIVTLPFKKTIQILGDSRDRAVKRLFAVETKLAKNPELRQEYTAFMREYTKLRHMELIKVILHATSCGRETLKHYYESQSGI